MKFSGSLPSQPMTRGQECATIRIMHSFTAYVAATSTMVGCIFLPLLILQTGLDQTDVTFKLLVTDRDARRAVHDDLASVIMAQLTFTSIATLAGAAVAAAWWMVPASHSHTNPLSFALTGAGVGLIASINLSVPALGPLAFAKVMPKDADETTRQDWWWLLHGPLHGPPGDQDQSISPPEWSEYRSLRLLMMVGLYLLVLFLYALWVFFVAYVFYRISHVHWHPFWCPSWTRPVC
jgi:hypothetical protein